MMSVDPPPQQVAAAVRAALAAWPSEANWTSPDQCWIGFVGYEDGGYRLTIETATEGLKLAANPTTAENAGRTLRDIAAQATAAADAIAAATEHD